MQVPAIGAGFEKSPGPARKAGGVRRPDDLRDVEELMRAKVRSLRGLAVTAIRNFRPAVVLVSVAFLILLGLSLILCALPLMALGYVFAGPALIEGAWVAAAGAMCLGLAWGLAKGRFWAWGATMLVAPWVSSVAFLQLISSRGVYALVSGLVLSSLLAIQLVLLVGPARGWIFSSTRLLWHVRDLELIARSGLATGYVEAEVERLVGYLRSHYYASKFP
jgi:hypothetical protein